MRENAVQKYRNAFQPLFERLRESKFFGRGDTFVPKFPDDVVADEENHICGVALADVGSGATVPFQIFIPRRAIIRQLIISRSDANHNNGLVVVSLKVQGNDRLQAGQVTANVYSPFAFTQPKLNEECPASTTVVVQLLNNTAAAINQVSVAVLID